VPPKPWVILIAVMTLCTFLSAWISNPAASVLCVSVILPVLRDMPQGSKYPRAMLLGIAYAGNVGGMTTPIASPQNAIALSTLNDLVPAETIPFSQWLMISIPFCTVALIGCFLFIWFIIRPTDKDPGDSECSLDLGYAALFHSECDVPDHSDVVVRRSLGRLYGEHWCHGLDSCDLFLWIRILDCEGF